MKPVRFKAIYLGGHPSRQKEKKNAYVVVDGEGVRVGDGFRDFLEEPWARITTIAAEGPEEIRRRTTLTRWVVLVGPAALLWKKKVKNEFFVVVEGTFGGFALQVKAMSKYALQAQLAPWAQLSAVGNAGEAVAASAGALATRSPITWESLVTDLAARYPVRARRRLGVGMLDTAKGLPIAQFVNGGVAVLLSDESFRDEVLTAIPGTSPYDPGFLRELMKEWIYIPAALSAEWEYVVEEAIKTQLELEPPAAPLTLDPPPTPSS